MPNWDNTELLRLLNAHYIRLPANFGARVYRSTTESHTNTGNWQDVTFDTERWDTGITNAYVDGIWKAGEPKRLTATHAGWYDIWGCISFAASATGGLRQVGIELNGASYISINGNHTPLANNPCTIDVSTKWWMDVGDYVRLSGWQNSGGNLDMLRAADYSIEFAMVRIP